MFSFLRFPALKYGNVFSAEGYKKLTSQNAQLINEQLSVLTVAGWEFVQPYTPINSPNARCCLFRKAKNYMAAYKLACSDLALGTVLAKE
ncbi:MAG: hypothetical protein ACRYF0_05005 [Janthinobacterium lividum]